MIKTFKTIYKKTNGGKIQIWYGEVEGGKYRTVSGQIDGKKVVSEWRECQPKNIGRSNETNAEEQAICEIEALYKKRLEKDYHEQILNIEEERYFKPQLAEKYEGWDNRDFGFVQPKLDGIRNLNSVNGMFSRNGKQIVSCPHIENSLKIIFENNPDIVQIDGELYNHDLKDDFNTIASLVTKKKVNFEDLQTCSSIIQYHVYDAVFVEPLSFEERFSKISNILKEVNHIVLVPTHKVKSKEEYDELHEKYLIEGYEGSMLRTNNIYQNKRTKDLLKRKEFIDKEYVIFDILPGVGNWANYAKRIQLIDENGNIFGSGVKGDREYCKELLDNKEKYVNKVGTVTFFSYTPDGVPRFPVFKGVREKGF